jgi:hypothetical protein
MSAATTPVANIDRAIQAMCALRTRSKGHVDPIAEPRGVRDRNREGDNGKPTVLRKKLHAVSTENQRLVENPRHEPGRIETWIVSTNNIEDREIVSS